MRTPNYFYYAGEHLASLDLTFYPFPPMPRLVPPEAGVDLIRTNHANQMPTHRSGVHLYSLTPSVLQASVSFLSLSPTVQRSTVRHVARAIDSTNHPSLVYRRLLCSLGGRLSEVMSGASYTVVSYTDYGPGIYAQFIRPESMLVK
jgi:hypothetical protein